MSAPFIPQWTAANKGMVAAGLLNPAQVMAADSVWLSARDAAVHAAQALADLGVAKQDANRLLEPFMFTTIIATANERAWRWFFGLRDDGSDPVADVERLTRALHDVAERLGCADYDDVVAAVSDALDDAEKREREHVDEANALRMERDRLTAEVDRMRAAVDRFAVEMERSQREYGERIIAAHDAAVATLTRERDEARAALMHFASRCAHGAIATWSFSIDVAPTKCDACRRDTSVEHEHAAALRAAGGGR